MKPSELYYGASGIVPIFKVTIDHHQIGKYLAFTINKLDRLIL
jgi:hypothetical protein